MKAITSTHQLLNEAISSKYDTREMYVLFKDTRHGAQSWRVLQRELVESEMSFETLARDLSLIFARQGSNRVGRDEELYHHK